MRKLFWGCLASGVAVAGGTLGVMYHGCRHPDTLVGKCVRTASCFVTTGGAVPLVTEKVYTHSEGEAAEEGTSAMPPFVEGEEEAIEPGSQAPQSGVVGPETAPITIHEEEPAPTPLVPPEGSGTTIDRGDLPEKGAEQALVPGHCPQEMPYCVDEKKITEPKPEIATLPDEPAVEETQPSTGAGEECETTTFWQMMMEMFKIEMPAWWCEPAEEPAPMTTEDSVPENHSYHHHHHSGCPYSGHCPYTGRCAPTPPPVVETPATPETVPTMPETVPAMPETKAKPENGGEEPSEDANLTALRQALKLRHRVKGEKVEVAPAHPEVDTMEFRPSDAKLYDYKNAGPL